MVSGALVTSAGSLRISVEEVSSAAAVTLLKNEEFLVTGTPSSSCAVIIDHVFSTTISGLGSFSVSLFSLESSLLTNTVSPSQCDS